MKKIKLLLLAVILNQTSVVSAQGNGESIDPNFSVAGAKSGSLTIKEDKVVENKNISNSNPLQKLSQGKDPEEMLKQLKAKGVPDHLIKNFEEKIKGFHDAKKEFIDVIGVDFIGKDSDKSGALTFNEYAKDVTDQWVEADSNKNKFLTKSDWIIFYMKKVNKISQKHQESIQMITDSGKKNIERVFALVDKNKDGKVSEDEFYSKIKASFDLYDKNKDSLITVQEYTNNLLSEKDYQSYLNKSKVNYENQINYENQNNDKESGFLAKESVEPINEK